MIYIIGSGLSGIAAAMALVKRGLRPTILDAGIPPDSASRRLKSRLASTEPHLWNSDDVTQLKRMGPPAPSGIPQKLHFGSNFAYRDADPGTTSGLHHASILRTFAQGGFTNVWGAVVQPLPAKELERWPVTLKELSTHYSAVSEFMSPRDATLRPTTQARQLHDDLTHCRRELEREGIRFQYASLAVRTSDDENGKGCRYCGVCLYGCPYGSIFSAASQLEAMVRSGQISYVSDVLVDRISKSPVGVRVEARSARDNSPRTFEGQSAFLAAGLLESARIILNSTNQSSKPLPVQQSDIFTIPLLRYRSAKDISRERLHTLCQTVVEVNDSAICPQPVQLQLYGYNDLYPQLLARRLGLLARPLEPLLRTVSARLMVAFGYLHSDVSSRVWITRTGDRSGRLRLEGQANPESQRIGRAVVRKLSRMRHHLRTVPLPMQLRFDQPGGGHRSGGCFPMRRSPAELETDSWGCIPELPGVHIVDSSVLPSVPACPVAFTAMANAHRIASGCRIENE